MPIHWTLIVGLAVDFRKVGPLIRSLPFTDPLGLPVHVGRLPASSIDPNRPSQTPNIQEYGRSKSIAPTVGSSEHKILQNRIARLLKLIGRSIEINSTLVQVGNMIGDIERAFHVVRDHDACHSQPLL